MPVFLVRATSDYTVAPKVLKRLLVPLDGSKLAEQALTYVEHLAAASPDAEVTLLYVEQSYEVATFSRRPTRAFGEPREDDLNSYLTTIISGLASVGIKAQLKVRLGHPAEQITEEAQEGSVDLVVMSSHGRTGLARWAFGSVADQVLHTSPTPILLIPSQVSGIVPFHLQGPSVYRCHHCGRRTYLETLTSKSQCPRCQYFLKACGNCVNFDGLGCLLQLPYASEVYAGNRCPQFEFRKTRLTLR